MRQLAWMALVACSSAAPSTEKPTPPMAPADAAVAIDASAGVPDEVMNAPTWIFKYTTADRAETWTLRFAAGNALLEVETGTGTVRYTGTATEGASITLDVVAPTAKMKLDCKRAKRGLSAKCNDSKAKPVQVLDCFHPDFKAPMPFGSAPGVEYIVDKTCNGYRLPPR